MILYCSRGCRWDTSDPRSQHLKPGDRCPNATAYDRIDGTTYCRRVLRDRDRLVPGCLGRPLWER